MIDQISNDSLVAWLAWIHLALFAVPWLIFTAYLEWKDWKAAHPTQYRTAPRRPSLINYHPV